MPGWKLPAKLFLCSMWFLLSLLFRLCCQSISLQSWPVPSRPARSPGTSTPPPSSLVLELPQWVWPVRGLESEQCLAASSLVMPGKACTHNVIIIIHWIIHSTAVNTWPRGSKRNAYVNMCDLIICKTSTGNVSKSMNLSSFDIQLRMQNQKLKKLLISLFGNECARKKK